MQRESEVPASDTSVTKVNGTFSPKGPRGETYLASGKRMAMRLWVEEIGDSESEHAREYETIGYVLEGSAELRIEGQTIKLEAGDSWVVPRGSLHQYRILEPFKAVEATSPPAHVHGRDEP